MMEDPLFCRNFWGDKHLGFDAMYLNMKHGARATSDFLEFLRESSSIEDTYIKAQAKLAKQLNNYTNSGSFLPCWAVLLQTVEGLGAIHADIMTDWQTLTRDVQRYLEEQQRRHKAIKDGEVGSQEIVRAFQSASVQLVKARDLFHTRYGECEKTRRNESSSTREVERAENKLKKAQDEYKYLIERYNNLRQQFYNKICDSCGHFQEVEQTHLEQMRSFLRRYGGAWKKGHRDVGKLCNEFDSLHSATGVDQLLRMLVAEKGTGSQEPHPAVFEEPEVTAAFAANNSDLQSGGGSMSSSTYTGGTSAFEAQQQRAASATNERMTRKNSVSDLFERVSNYSDRSISLNEQQQNVLQPPPSSAGVVAATQPLSTGGGSGGKKRSGGGGEHSVAGGFFNRRRRNSHSDSKGKKKGTAAASKLTANANLGGTGGGPAGTATPTDWRSETPVEPALDVEGFSIPPSNPWGTKEESSSSSSSEEEEDPVERTYRDLKFEIKPLNRQSSVDASPSPATGPPPTLGGLDALREAMDQVRLSPTQRNTPPLPSLIPAPAPVPGRAAKSRSVTPHDPGMKKSTSMADQLLLVSPTTSSTVTSNPVSPLALTSITAGRAMASNGASGGEEGFDWLAGGGSASGGTVLSTSEVPVIMRKQPGDVRRRSAVYRRKRGAVVIALPSPDSSTMLNDQELGSLRRRISSTSGGDNNSTNSTVARDSIFTSDGPSTGNGGHPPPASLPPNVDLINLASWGSTPPASPAITAANNGGSTGSVLSANLFGEMPSIPPAVPARPRPNASGNSTGGQQQSRSNTPDPWGTPSPLANDHLISTGFATNFDNTSSIAPPSLPTSRRPVRRPETPDSTLAPAAHHHLPTWGDARGPSPIPLARSDPLPLAVAFTETWNARFIGSSGSQPSPPVGQQPPGENRVTGELSMAFPVGILKHLTDPSHQPQPLLFRITNAGRVRRLVINAKLVSDDLAGPDMYQLSMNMPSLVNQLRLMREQNPGSKYFNVDLIKYEVILPPDQPPPLDLAAYWKCEEATTDFHLDYTTHWTTLQAAAGTPAMTPEVRFNMPVEGSVRQMQSLPAGAWSDEAQRATWRLSPEAVQSPRGNLRAKFALSKGPGSPLPISVQFVCEGVHLSGAEFSLAGSGYRLSLSKKRLISGNYICEPEQGIRFV